MKKITRWMAAACLLVFSSCSKQAPTEPEPVVPVQVTAVRLDSIRRIISADAVLYPRNQANVMPKISAPVRKFYVNRGDPVREGQLLAVLENRDLVATALEAKGQYEQAESNYRATASATVPEAVAKAKADAEAAKQALDAARKLLENRQKLYEQGALARKLVDDAQVAYAQAESQYETARSHLIALQSVGKQEQIKGAAAQAESAKGHQQAAQAQLSYSEIRSPMTGVITDRGVYEGEMANAGTPLLTVMDVSRVVARANVAQNVADFIKVGSDAVINQTEGAEPVAAKVIVVSPAVDPNTTTVQVWVQSANQQGQLKPGTTVHVSIVAETLPTVPVVPPAALLSSAEGEPIVMVVGSDSKAHEHKVEVGIREPEKVQIVSGVSPGDRVITVGGVGLEDDAKVRVESPGASPAADEKKSGGAEK